MYSLKKAVIVIKNANEIPISANINIQILIIKINKY